MGKINKSWYTSTTDLWATPRHVFEELNREFAFDLDPCAIPENAKCPRFFTPEDDGLAQNWGGCKVFCNPPYSDIKRWVRKCYEESQKPGTVVVLLIPSRTDTSYFHDFIYHKAEIRFIRGRLKYNDGKGTAPFPSLIAIYRHEAMTEQEQENKQLTLF